jgi:hypothetical protein
VPIVMGLPTWAKRKLEENWPSLLSEAITNGRLLECEAGRKIRVSEGQQVPSQEAKA